AGQKFGIWMNGASNNVGYATNAYNGQTTVTYVTFTAIAPTTGNEKLLSLYNYPSGSTTATVNWVALYKGNKPMDWSENDQDARNDLRLSAPLPTNITMDTNGFTATVSAALNGTLDNTKYARLDYRGLYITGGAVQ